MLHALYPPPPCHKLPHLLGPPPPLEHDVLYGWPLDNIFKYVNGKPML